MDYDKLVEGMENLSKKLNIIQDYISYKFGADFKEFCGIRGQPEMGSCRCHCQNIRQHQHQHSFSMEMESELEKESTAEQNFPIPIKVEAEDFEIGADDEDHEESSNELSFILRPPKNGKEKISNFLEEEEDEETDPLCADPDFPDPSKRKQRLQTPNLNSQESQSQPSAPSGESCNPDLNRHAHFGVLYGINKIGNEKMIYQGYSHFVRKTSNSGVKKYWACTLKKCGASMVVDGINEVIKVLKPHDSDVHTDSVDRMAKSARKRQKLGESEDDSTFEPITKDPNRHDYFGISYSSTKQGGEKLSFAGYVYRLNKVSRKKKIWVCSNMDRMRCAGRLIQDEDGSPNLTKEHSHPPIIGESNGAETNESVSSQTLLEGNVSNGIILEVEMPEEIMP